MRYMVLIYDNEAAGYPALSEAERDAVNQSYGDFAAELARAGIKMNGEALQSSDTATTLRVRDGKTITTDGPFAETKEQLGGYYILECKDLDEALTWAAKTPGVTRILEVRPMRETS